MLKLNNYNSSILKEVYLELSSPQNLIILGNNGAGKTTLAKVLSGIIDNNSCLVDNQIISTLYGTARTKLINYIPTKLEVFDEYLSVFEFLTLSCLDEGGSINNILELLEICYLKDKLCINLSSGEAALVLLASAILHNARFTILDEINSNLDPQKQKLVYQILKNNEFLQSKCIITHNLNFAFKLGFDILYLGEGKTLFYGKNSDFFDEQNLFKFFGHSVKRVENMVVVAL